MLLCRNPYVKSRVGQQFAAAGRYRQTPTPCGKATLAYFQPDSGVLTRTSQIQERKIARHCLLGQPGSDLGCLHLSTTPRFHVHLSAAEDRLFQVERGFGSAALALPVPACSGQAKAPPAGLTFAPYQSNGERVRWHGFIADSEWCSSRCPASTNLRAQSC